MFNTREIATGIWLAILAVFALRSPSIRASVLSIVKDLASWTVSIPMLLLVVYMGFVVVGLRQVDLWDASLLKDTALWVLLSGVVLFVNVLSDDHGQPIWKGIIVDTMKAVVLLEFLVATFTFPLWIELLGLPVLAVFTGVTTLMEGKDQYGRPNRFAVIMQTIFGVGVLGYVTFKAATNLRELTTIDSLRQVLLAPLLSVASIPFIAGVALMSAYEKLFKRFGMGSQKSARVRWYGRLRFLFHFRHRRERIHEFLRCRPLAVMNASTIEAVRSLLHENELRPTDILHND